MIIDHDNILLTTFVLEIWEMLTLAGTMLMRDLKLPTALSSSHLRHLSLTLTESKNRKVFPLKSL